MTLCPLAAVAGCNHCPVNKLCLAKGILGNDKPNKSPDQDVDIDVTNNHDKSNQVLK